MQRLVPGHRGRGGNQSRRGRRRSPLQRFRVQASRFRVEELCIGASCALLLDSCKDWTPEF
jgi:hypothetical protein